jgi:glycosyltransferase involved in cell wall biosynthesis
MGFFRRMGDLLRALRADIVIVQREAAPFGPAIFEWIIGRVLRKPVVYDIDDPVFVPYISPTYGALLSRLKFPGKTRTLVRISRKVICASRYVLTYVQSAGNDGIIIPTIVDTNVFKPLRRPTRDLPVIGWVGSHSTAQYLKLIIAAMQQLAQRRAFIFRIVGAERKIKIEGVQVENVEWTLGGEVGFFQDLDIGIYPIIEDDWSKGKTGFKAIQYMSVGVPPVCSPVGEVTEVVKTVSQDSWLRTPRSG